MRDVPVIDLFAGPGGLSFGFSSFRDAGIRFRVALSIEKEPVAHQTLLLRAFLRQFETLPGLYYEFLRSPTKERLDKLRTAHADKWHLAELETKCWELGKQPFEDVSKSIVAALAGARDWILLGGPPCQAYSLAGRSRMKNQAGFASDHRHTLYKEYLRVVAVHEPPVFVMENVKGILSSRHGTKSKGGSIFEQILSDLRDPVQAMRKDPATSRHLVGRSSAGYTIYSFTNEALSPELLRPSDFVIRSEEWGVPQRRHRVILLGIRNDRAEAPKTLSDFFPNETHPIDSVIGTMPRIRSRISSDDDGQFEWRQALRMGASSAKSSATRDIGREMRSVLRTLVAPKTAGAPFIRGAGKFKPQRLADWLWDQRLGGVIQHEARGHMGDDISRYFFAACYARRAKRSPTLGCFPRALLPAHKNVAREDNEDFVDRFRVQVKSIPATTITSHISKDGHYYIHYDPSQARSLTVREAARLQTFPDTYFFCGARTAQYHQVGNAVPPLLASKLARVVADILNRNDARSSTGRKRSKTLA